MSILPLVISRPLKRFLSKYSWSLSQAGQDQWCFGEAFNEKIGGYFVDIGAHDGFEISNTYILERRYQWSGICIEANPISFKDLVKNRRSICVNTCLDSEAGEVDFTIRDVLGGIVAPGLDNEKATHSIIKLKTRTLVDVLREHAAPPVIDYLSIDVEGAEDRVLAKFNFELFKFKCITIERPSDALRAILARNGYVIVKEIIRLDCFYVHSDYLVEYKQNIFKFFDKKRLTFRWR